MNFFVLVLASFVGVLIENIMLGVLDYYLKRRVVSGKKNIKKN